MKYGEPNGNHGTKRSLDQASCEGHLAKPEIKEAVYRIDPKTTKIEMVADDLHKPNGICFSPDYKKVYICDTGAMHDPTLPKIVQV